MNGAELLTRCLEVAGSDTVFGVPGTQNTVIFEALRKSRLRTVLAMHELGAAFQANGYARTAGKPGIVMTIPGPGFMYALPGIVEALHDSAPIVMFTPRAHEMAGKAFQLQVLDQATLAAGAFKNTIVIEQADGIPEGVFEALRASRSGEPGPILVDLSDSALREEVAFQPPLPGSFENAMESGEPPGLDAALTRVLEAERPVLFFGQGTLGAADAMLPLAESLGSAVVTNSSGRGVIPENHPRSVCGDFSGWGTDLLNALIDEADLVLAIGCKFSANGSSAFSLRIPREKLVHVDSSAEVLNANYPARFPLQMDAGDFAKALMKRVETAGGERRGWTSDEIRVWKNAFSKEKASAIDRFPRLASGRADGLLAFFRGLEGSLPQDAIVVTDTGLHQTVVRQLHQVNAPGGLLIPADFQSMGFGVPAAIGAALASPNRRVVAITGDGGMLMAGMELLAAVREGVTLTVIVFNDGYLGLIRNQQIADFGHPYATELGSLDFQALAETVGADYVAWDAGSAEFSEGLLEHEGVRVVDLRLRDGPAVRKMRARALTRNALEKVVGEKVLTSVKRWIRGLLPGSRSRG